MSEQLIKKELNPDSIYHRKIGGLWLKTSQRSGEKFLSGELDENGVKRRIVILKNNHKRKETFPDYEIFLNPNDKSLAKDLFKEENKENKNAQRE